MVVSLTVGSLHVTDVTSSVWPFPHVGGDDVGQAGAISVAEPLMLPAFVLVNVAGTLISCEPVVLFCAEGHVPPLVTQLQNDWPVALMS